MYFVVDTFKRTSCPGPAGYVSGNVGMEGSGCKQKISVCQCFSKFFKVKEVMVLVNPG